MIYYLIFILSLMYFILRFVLYLKRRAKEKFVEKYVDEVYCLRLLEATKNNVVTWYDKTKPRVFFENILIGYESTPYSYYFFIYKDNHKLYVNISNNLKNKLLRAIVQQKHDYMWSDIIR